MQKPENVVITEHTVLPENTKGVTSTNKTNIFFRIAISCMTLSKNTDVSYALVECSLWRCHFKPAIQEHVTSRQITPTRDLNLQPTTEPDQPTPPYTPTNFYYSPPN